MLRLQLDFKCYEGFFCFRVPMSLGAPREEKDKSGNPCFVCDVAVNSVWYSDTMVSICNNNIK